MKPICQDLADEYAALDEMVKGLDDEGWRMCTPFFNWTIKDEISHLAYFDRAAFLSATDAAAFSKDMESMLEGFTDFDAMHRKVNGVGGGMTNADLLTWWRDERARLLAAYENLSPDARLPWYGPSMSARSSATARIMETWAHGQDIADALKMIRPGTDRLKHIAFLGISTFKWSFKNRGTEVPEKLVRVSLTSPSGDCWDWGPEDAENVVFGPALDFCLVITQRRNVADTKLKLQGDIAIRWMAIAQAFAGPAEEPPAPGVRKNNKG